MLITSITIGAVLGCLMSFTSPALAGRETITFNEGWRFARFGAMSDGSEKAEPPGLEQPAGDDSGWRTLNLPHDWGIEGPFRADLPNNTGKLPWAGIGWYRKSFLLDKSDKGRRIFLDFDGAMSHPKVFVNGVLAGEWAYGYSSFRVEITSLANFGATNLIAVRLDNPAGSSRWYPGGGIYRDVRLVKTAPVYVTHWGVFVLTTNVSETRADVVVQTTVDNQSKQSADVRVRQEVLAPDGKVLATEESKPIGLSEGTNGQVTTSLNLNAPRLWDVHSPLLHTLRTSVLLDGKEVDCVETPFGIRRIEWTADRGFLLNGRVVKLQGVCNHHDLGALGAAFNERAAERQLEILREMGCNAIRTAHNPPAPQLLDLCDRMGFLVVDELFDCWGISKTPGDYAGDFDVWHERDVANFVRRDRNHPSVILWSAGNEIPEQVAKGGNHERARHLVELFHREDPTRLVTCGMNNPRSVGNGFAATLDVAGYNYKAMLAKTPNYLNHVQNHPSQPFFGSETASTVSSRGVYFFPVSKEKDGGFFQFQVSSYDFYSPPWANIPDFDFDSADQLPALAGEFVWTGFDYLGEPTPYNKDNSNLLNFHDEAERAVMQAEMDRLGGAVPSRSSYFGIVDLAGFPKDRYYLYQSRWRPDLPMAHLLPHWNWPERIDQITPVQVYTSGDEAELFLNGTSLGRKKKREREYRLRWDDVKYQPGELKVVAYRNGKPWAEDVMKTTGEAAKIELFADRPTLKADGSNLAFITVQVSDKDGLLVPRSHNRIRFALEGPGEIIATDNGDPTSHESFQAPEREVFNGLALVVVRSKQGASGTVVLSAQSEGLRSSEIKLEMKP